MVRVKILRTAARAVFYLVYSVTFAEMFLRLFAPVAVFPRFVTDAPYGVRINEPNRSYWHTSADVNIQIRTNSKGIRADEEIPYERPNGMKRILVLGDSFAMGYEATLEEMFTTVMANTLRSEGFKIQIVNLSVSGHSNAEELVVFHEEGRKYQPDLVLLCWHASDLTENVTSALYEVKENELVRKNSAYLPGVDAQRRLSRIPGFEWVSSYSQLYSWARENLVIKVIKPALLVLQESRRTAKVESSAGRTDGYAADLTVRLLRRISKEVNESGAAFLILDIPNLTSRDELKSKFPQDAATELPVISPIAAFEANRKYELYHKRSHRHFTPMACKIVGQLLAKEISDRHLLSRD